jgi:hypothetical protein
MERLVLGLFDNLAAAKNVDSELRRLNIPGDRIHVTSIHHGEAQAAIGEPCPEPTEEVPESSVLRRLLEKLGISRNHPLNENRPDGRLFSEGLRRGRVLVVVSVEDERRVDQVEDAFERYGALDIDERADDWGLDAHREEQPADSPASTVPLPSADTATAVAPPAQPRKRKRATRVFSRKSEPLSMTPEALDEDYRMHFGRVYGSSGHEYAYYLPAYRYGSELAQSGKFPDWRSASNFARQDWIHRAQEPWQSVHDAVLFGWDRSQGAVQSAAAPQ